MREWESDCFTGTCFVGLFVYLACLFGLGFALRFLCMHFCPRQPTLNHHGRRVFQDNRLTPYHYHILHDTALREGEKGNIQRNWRGRMRMRKGEWVSWLPWHRYTVLENTTSRLLSVPLLGRKGKLADFAVCFLVSEMGNSSHRV